jgi:adenosine kinase
MLHQFYGGVLNVSCLAGKELQTFPVIKLSADQIIDTNGAGDAFVGGKCYF